MQPPTPLPQQQGRYVPRGAPPANAHHQSLLDGVDIADFNYNYDERPDVAVLDMLLFRKEPQKYLCGS